MTERPPAAERDLDKIDQVFRERVDELIRRMTEAGFDPYVFEARRSFERAEYLARKGTGVSRSMHCYGLAVDIISRSKMWSASGLFWVALAREARRLGLTTGADFERYDAPHVQALPGNLDHWVRRATDDEISARVAEHLAPTDPDRRPTIKTRPSGKPPGSAA